MSISSSDSLNLPSDDEVHIGTIGQTAFKPLPTASKSSPPSPVLPAKPTNPVKRYYQHLQGAPSFVERFEVGLQRTDIKVKTWKEERDKKEMAECTFAPVLTAKQSLTRHKTMSQMYTDAVAQAEDLQKRREAVLEKERISIGPFKPTLNPLSLKLAKTKRELQEDFYTYLHRTKTSEHIRKTYNEEKPCFRPSINPKSAGIQRTQNIEDLLMEDARKRKERQSLARCPSLPDKLISPHSEKMLSDKFEAEFTAEVRGIGAEEELSKAQMYTVLRDMHFVKEVSSPLVEELWRYLRSDGKDMVPVKLVLCILVVIQHLPSLTPLSSQAVTNIRQTFRPLYLARQEAISKSQLNPTYKFQVTYPFQPDITKTGFMMVSPRTERTSLKSEELNRYFETKREEVGIRVKAGTAGGEARPSSGSILGQYIQISKSTVKRPQDRNEALFRLASLQPRHHSTLSST